METPLTSLVIYWLPLILVGGAWLLFARHLRKGPKYIRDINENFIRQNEEIISLLRDIKTSLENRKP